MAAAESPFMRINVSRLLRRYDISYFKEDNCTEYFIADRITKEHISYAIILSLNTSSKEIHVSRFCPELYKQNDSKYLSAACFYLLIHHFGDMYHLDERYHISLETRPVTYERFFSKLKDFHLRNNGLKLNETVSVLGDYPPLHIDTSMIGRKALESERIPFQV